MMYTKIGTEESADKLHKIFWYNVTYPQVALFISFSINKQE